MRIGAGACLVDWSGGVGDRRATICRTVLLATMRSGATQRNGHARGTPLCKHTVGHHLKCLSPPKTGTANLIGAIAISEMAVARKRGTKDH